MAELKTGERRYLYEEVVALAMCVLLWLSSPPTNQMVLLFFNFPQTGSPICCSVLCLRVCWKGE
jgi:hypothetical protein